MSRLAGKFAGIVVVSVADARVDALTADLGALSEQGLQVLVERTDEPVDRESLRLSLDLLGADHPGIVAEISASLAAHDVNIEELSTDVRDAPMSGGTIFQAHAVLTAPLATTPTSCASLLEGLANELMVEIRLSDELSTLRFDVGVQLRHHLLHAPSAAPGSVRSPPPSRGCRPSSR